MFLGWRWGVLALVLGAAVGARIAWVWQTDELTKQAAGYERQLAAKDLAHGREREQAAEAALGQAAIHQAQRLDLEDRLQAQDKTHWKEMNDAQQAQARLRDRLATADLRLSVLLDAGTAAAQGGDSGMRAPAGTGGLVDGALRAQLDPAHARRIIAITNEGDRGLIALKACQGYVREVIK
ncbi:lysis system i-spanin subunit Rz [Pseudomonas chlororaphis subsp. aurantiaca]|uniref:lysis system i-spanin subunit Rz n=1 Tax=Pseudomonas chlororaphis TaxID=587753 RepID=UPI0027DDC1B7|nr:lysis system i-spanin subunit Rz [Pseudomonas chlororaphis]WMJ01410.1 lysis system i-spanin subunit Rz [Pseudomonas chlororaphis subsp. aurantiaca]